MLLDICLHISAGALDIDLKKYKKATQLMLTLQVEGNKEYNSYYCCPIKLVSFYRHVLGYRSGGSRVTFIIYKPPLFKQ